MGRKILVETSARHIHLSQTDLEALFGEGYVLTNKKDLSQPGQFVCEEKVTLVGPKGEMKLSILGPTRSHTQIELSLTDARSLGVKTLIKESGEIEGTAGGLLIGPVGEVTLSQGVMIAKRHVHMNHADAQEFGVQDKEIVNVEIINAERALTFSDVVCRVSDDYALAMHIDTDESNAAGMPCEGIIIKL